MKFRSDNAKLAIRIPHLGKTLRFSRGAYSTDDPAEIGILRGHSLVEIDLPSKRSELDDQAREAGVKAPEELPSKDAVKQAITEAE